MERPSAIFCNGKYITLDDFRYVKFSAYCTLGNKSSKTGEYQSNELEDNLSENNNEEYSYPHKTKLIISGETMRC